jgi:hypothetical protein
MPGMRERARKIGARLVEMKIPGSVAYRRSNERSRWQWFRGAMRRGRTQ